MFFSSYARSVTLLVRGPSLEKSMSHYLIEQLKTKRNIAVETQTTVVSVAGDSHIESIVTRDERTGATTTRRADALFSFIGADADTAWLGPELERDERGYLKTGRDLETWDHPRPPYSLETSVPGIFAVGDVRSTSIKRVASGVGEGSVVIAFVHQYLEGLRTPAPA
jgi:thioredoxin reductase (NADPH)